MEPYDFCLFSDLKKTLERRRFAITEDVKIESLKELKALAKNEFQMCFDGDYFEGNKINTFE